MSVSLYDLATGVYDPPGDSTGCSGAWTDNVGLPDVIHMTRIYRDLVTDADWPVGFLRDYISPTALWPHVSHVSTSSFPDTVITVDYDTKNPVVWCNWLWNTDPDQPSDIITVFRNATPGIITFLGGNGGALNPNVDDDPTDGRLVSAMVLLHWAWCAYITRSKIAMQRARCFGWTPSQYRPEAYTVDDMSYDSVSSWFRVNKYARANAALKSYVEADAAVIEAGALLDADLQAFATATGVQMPGGATSVAGDRLPVCKALWEGRLPFWFVVEGSQQHGTLDTRQIAKDFTDHAGSFREAVGRAYAAWGYLGHKLDGSA